MLSKLTQLARAVKRRLVPRDAHSSLRMWLVGPWEDAAPQLVADFDAQPVLVLAPHPDDEIVGPGGTIRRHILAGAAVTVAILTDGRWGGYNGDGKLVERRKEESRRAAQILGTPAPIFFDAPDRELGQTPRILEKILQLFLQTNPQYVYLPALTDFHPDHWSTNCLLHKIVSQLPRPAAQRLVIRGYELWTPALANCCVDITATIDVKRQAIEAFVSQTSVHDYAAAVLGLNRYRSLQHLYGKGHVEAFMQMTADEFSTLFTAASLRHEAGPH